MIEIHEITPIGSFILEQKDLPGIPGTDGQYWHYRDVCQLLHRILKDPTWNENEDEEEPEFVRASGDVICEFCNKPYHRHRKHLKYKWLNVLCDKTLVKL